MLREKTDIIEKTELMKGATRASIAQDMSIPETLQKTMLEQSSI